MKRGALWVHFVLSAAIPLLVFLQVYFISAYFMGAGDGALDAHGLVGGLLIHGFELIVMIAGFIAWWRVWSMVGASVFLFVFGTVQIFLLPPDDDPGSGWVHALHGLFAMGVMLTAAWIAWRDARALGLGRGPTGGAHPAEPAPSTVDAS